MPVRDCTPLFGFATVDRRLQAINKSLSALADVFVAKGKKQPHVPYRNSKLTWLLQARQRMA